MAALTATHGLPVLDYPPSRDAPDFLLSFPYPGLFKLVFSVINVFCSPFLTVGYTEDIDVSSRRHSVTPTIEIGT